MRNERPISVCMLCCVLRVLTMEEAAGLRSVAGPSACSLSTFVAAETHRHVTDKLNFHWTIKSMSVRAASFTFKEKGNIFFLERHSENPSKCMEAQRSQTDVKR